MSKRELEDLLPKPRTEDEVATVKLLLMFTSLSERVGNLERIVKELPDKFQIMLEDAVGMADLTQKIVTLNKELAEELRTT